MLIGSHSMAADIVDVPSAFSFPDTLERLTQALTDAGMTIFARIDHQAGAAKVGMTMAPTTLIIYGNPKGGTPVMLSAPQTALDLPLRVLVREDSNGKTQVSFHPAANFLEDSNVKLEQIAPLQRAEAMIKAVVAPPH